MAFFWIALRYLAAFVGGYALWVSLIAGGFALYTLATEGIYGLTRDPMMPLDFHLVFVAVYFVVGATTLWPAIYAAMRMEGPEKRHGRIAVRIGIFASPVLIVGYLFLPDLPVWVIRAWP